MCAQFLQTNDHAFKFCDDDFLAIRSGQERSRDSMSVQQSSWSFSNKHQRFVWDNLPVLKKLNKCRVP